MRNYAVELSGVTLARGRRVVVSDVDVAIRPGEFIGVFGPNGAGKSTFLRALLGLIRPTKGKLTVDGTPPRRGGATTGYLPQQRTSVSDLRLRARDFVAAAHRGERWGLPIAGRCTRREVDAALADVQAEALATRCLCELSGGELQRLFLAQAVLGSPRLLLLDEPLAALDPHFQGALVALIKSIQTRGGTTVLFTAHDINPLLGVMDRVLYFGHGRAVLGTIDDVINSAALSGLYGTPIEVLRVHDQVLVLAQRAALETRLHRRDA